MRTYSNFLLFEGALEEIQSLTEASGNSVIMSQTVDRLMNPQVNIVEEDCGTLLGDVVPMSYDLEGYVDATPLLNGTYTSLQRGIDSDPPTKRTILNYIKKGIYSIRVRKIHSCQSVGGICRTCYRGSFIGNSLPSVGDRVVVPSSYILSSNSFTSDPGTTSYNLILSPDQYDYLVLVTGGEAVEDTNYEINDTTLSFNSTYPLGISAYTVHYYITDSEPLLGYLANSYSGSLLGLAPLPTEPLLVNKKVYQEFLTEPYIRSMLLEMLTYKNTPKAHLDYAEKIHDPLEQALFILFLFLTYSGITI
jgi:hypothetical protein